MRLLSLQTPIVSVSHRHGATSSEAINQVAILGMLGTLQSRLLVKEVSESGNRILCDLILGQPTAGKGTPWPINALACATTVAPHTRQGLPQ